MKQQMSESTCEDSQSTGSWKNDVYAKVKGPEKKGRVRCLGLKTSSSNNVGPSSSSRSVQRDEEVEGLKAQVQGLKSAFTTVVSLLQKQLPSDNVEILNTIARMVNGEVL